MKRSRTVRFTHDFNNPQEGARALAHMLLPARQAPTPEGGAGIQPLRPYLSREAPCRRPILRRRSSSPSPPSMRSR
jgi:hypothetical protein